MRNGRLARLGAGLLAALLLAASPAGAADLLITHARLVDGTGAAPREDVSILVRDGRIAAIGAPPPAANVRVLDAGGATVLPGLIDSHVHLQVVPGAALRNDSEATQRELRLHQLRSYLACGVTSVLDAGIEPEGARELKAAVSAGAAAPRLFFLGQPFTAPDGYLSFGAPVATPAEVRARLDAAQALGVVGIKVMIEHGWSPLEDLPSHSPEIRRVLMTETARRRLPIFVHASSEEDYVEALDLGARGIMHGLLYRDAPLSAGFLTRMKATGTYQVSTLSVMDALLIEFEPERLDDPLTQLSVPAAQLATARDPRSGRIHAEKRIAGTVGWLGGPVLRATAKVWFGEGAMRGALANAQRGIEAEYDAGIPIVVGSDSGNWPIVPYALHGVTTLREIELLAEPGLSQAAALAAATRTPARMLGLDAEIGTIEPGKRADLVIVRGDPLSDLRALRKVAWTVKDGVARTPAQWMAR